MTRKLLSAMLGIILLVFGCGTEPDDSRPTDDTGVADTRDAPSDAGHDTGDIEDGSDTGPADTPPDWPSEAEFNAIPTGPTSARLTWTAAQDDREVIAYDIARDGELLGRVPATRFSMAVDGLSDTGSYVFTVTALDELAQRSEALTTTFTPVIPAPEQVVGEPDPMATADLAERVRNLYTGDDPIQRDVAPGAIDEQRVSLIRGTVLDRDGSPIGGVHVRVHRTTELGHTLTRADGRFDIAVNGGGQVTLTLRADGYMTTQRTFTPSWKETALMERIVMVAYDPEVTTVDLSRAGQVARGSTVIDGAGARRGSLIFKQGTVAQMVLPDGSRQSLEELDVRISEYTVGESGPEAMPGALPPTSAYTYAVNLTVDEAERAGALRVDFDKPVAYYLDNFMGYAVGEPIPNGYYDFQRAVWVRDNEGLIVEILAVQNGRAVLDIDGSGSPADDTALAEIGVDEEELTALATIHDAGDQLWRVPLEHFTPYDCNWGVGCSPEQDCTGPTDAEQLANKGEEDCQFGSVLECRSRTLREQISLPGVPMDLHYASRFQPGFQIKRAFQVDLGDSIPQNYSNLIMGIQGLEGANTSIDLTSSELSSVVWDGKMWGERFNGGLSAIGYVGYCYVLVRRGTGFGSVPNDSAIMVAATGVDRGSDLNPANCLSSGMAFSGGGGFFVLYKKLRLTLEGWSVPGQHLGGWTLTPHHFYDRGARVLYRGDGTRRSATSPGVVETFAGTNGEGGGTGKVDGPVESTYLREPVAITFGADGTAYILENTFSRVHRVKDGHIKQIAGFWDITGNGATAHGYNGDNIPAQAARLNRPSGLAIGPAGDLYIADTNNHRIRKVDLQTHTITTVVGAGPEDTIDAGYQGDGGPAFEARLSSPSGVAFGPGGDMYIADTGNDAVRRVGPDGRIETVAGGNGQGFEGDGGMARAAKLRHPVDVALTSAGELLIADLHNGRIRRVRTTGRIETLAGTGSFSTATGRDGDALSLRLNQASSLAIGPDDTIYVGERQRVFTIEDGRIRTVFGRCWKTENSCESTSRTGSDGYDNDGDYGTNTRLEDLPPGVGVDPRGRLYITSRYHQVVRRLTPSIGDFDEDTNIIPSEDGSRVFVFDRRGRHLETRSLTDDAPLYVFGYDAAGRLVRVADADGLVTEIERDSDGLPAAIVGPYGERTVLALQGDGFEAALTAVTDTAGRSWGLAYDDQRLLTAMTMPDGRAYGFTYDDLGRLTAETTPNGGSKTLSSALADYPDAIEATKLTTAEGRETVYLRRRGPNDAFEVARITPDRLEEVTRILDDTRSETTYPNGVTHTVDTATDPAFPSGTLYAARTTETTPAGRTLTTEYTPTYTFADPADPLSVTELTQTTTVNGQTWTEAYDVDARLRTLTTPAGRTSTVEVDAMGRPTKTVEPGRAAVENQYDGRGRLSRNLMGNRLDSFEYSSDGGLSRVTTSLSGAASPAHELQMGYDELGRLTSVTRNDGSTVSYAWTDGDQLDEIRLPDGRKHTVTYDAAGNISSSKTPGGAATTWGWDADGRLLRQTLPSGTDLSFTYDDASRLKRTQSGVRVVDYSYDPATGMLHTMRDEAGEQLSFDWDGRMQTAERWSGTVAGSVSVAWSPGREIVERRVNDANPVAYTYDADGLLTRAGALALDHATGTTDFAGTTLGQVTTGLMFDAYGGLSEFEAHIGQAKLFGFSLEYDVMGRITRRVETIDGTTTTYDYGYDDVGRLSRVERDGNTLESYTYDAVGNRTRTTRDGGSQAASYDADDRLTSWGGDVYAYDADGNLTERQHAGGTTIYNYDGSGSLAGVDLSDGREVEYVNDPKGRRVAKFVDGVMERGWLYKDAVNPVAELDGSGRVVSRFVYGTFRHVPDYMMRDGKTYRLLHDSVGSVRLVVDAADGTIVQRVDYDAFGRVLQDTNPAFQPFGFAGGLWDPDTQLVQFGLRHYEPHTGRWTQPEPLGLDHGALNLYEYTHNDPLRFIDPDGALPVLAVVAIGAALSIYIDFMVQYAAKGCINWWQLGLAGVLGGATGGFGAGVGGALATRLTAGFAFKTAFWQSTAQAAKTSGQAALLQIATSNISRFALKKGAIEFGVASAFNAFNGAISSTINNFAAGKTALNTGENGLFSNAFAGATNSVMMGGIGGAIGGRVSSNLAARYYDVSNAVTLGTFASGSVGGIPLSLDHWTGQ